MIKACAAISESVEALVTGKCFKNLSQMKVGSIVAVATTTALLATVVGLIAYAAGGTIIAIIAAFVSAPFILSHLSLTHNSIKLPRLGVQT